MLRFNNQILNQMLNQVDFNTSYVTVQRTVTIKLEFIPEFQYILCYGSTSPPSSGLGLVTSFQYILCYGSTLIHQLEAICARHFNTSYVTVQLMGLCLILPLKKISIHLMLRFNKNINRADYADPSVIN